jgi:hypothetical protein
MGQRDRQLNLKLPAPKRWGGRRDGAGRKPGEHPRLRHRSRDRFSSVLPAHVTVRLLPGLLSLRTVKLVREVERTFAGGCERSDFRLVHYSLQGNHAHLVVEARDRDALGRGMMAIGSRLARAVNRVMGRTGGVLAERYHVRLLKTPREVQRALRYVLLNGRRHAARTARKAVRAMHCLLDPASSARWFDGWKRSAPGAPEPRAPAGLAFSPCVARARTWLLTVGWRRHGLLDPADEPGRPVPA